MERRAALPTRKGAPEIFAGDVWIDDIPGGDPPWRTRIMLVRFAPGARMAWHSHANGHTLHVVEGVGLVQAREGDVLVVRSGDTVWTPPAEWHWHGAAPDHFMSHLSITEGLSEGQEGPEIQFGDHVDYDVALLRELVQG